MKLQRPIQHPGGVGVWNLDPQTTELLLAHTQQQQQQQGAGAPAQAVPAHAAASSASASLHPHSSGRSPQFWFAPPAGTSPVQSKAHLACGTSASAQPNSLAPPPLSTHSSSSGAGSGSGSGSGSDGAKLAWNEAVQSQSLPGVSSAQLRQHAIRAAQLASAEADGLLRAVHGVQQQIDRVKRSGAGGDDSGETAGGTLSQSDLSSREQRLRKLQCMGLRQVDKLRHVALQARELLLDTMPSLRSVPSHLSMSREELRAFEEGVLRDGLSLQEAIQKAREAAEHVQAMEAAPSTEGRTRAGAPENQVGDLNGEMGGVGNGEMPPEAARQLDAARAMGHADGQAQHSHAENEEHHAGETDSQSRRVRFVQEPSSARVPGLVPLHESGANRQDAQSKAANSSSSSSSSSSSTSTATSTYAVLVKAARAAMAATPKHSMVAPTPNTAGQSSASAEGRRVDSKVQALRDQYGQWLLQETQHDGRSPRNVRAVAGAWPPTGRFSLNAPLLRSHGFDIQAHAAGVDAPVYTSMADVHRREAAQRRERRHRRILLHEQPEVVSKAQEDRHAVQQARRYQHALRSSDTTRHGAATGTDAAHRGSDQECETGCDGGAAANLGKQSVQAPPPAASSSDVGGRSSLDAPGDSGGASGDSPSGDSPEGGSQDSGNMGQDSDDSSGSDGTPTNSSEHKGAEPAQDGATRPRNGDKWGLRATARNSGSEDDSGTSQGDAGSSLGNSSSGSGGSARGEVSTGQASTGGLQSDAKAERSAGLAPDGGGEIGSKRSRSSESAVGVNKRRRAVSST